MVKIDVSGYLRLLFQQKMQTAYVSSLGHLQTPGEDHIPSLMRRIRISRLKCCSLTSDRENTDFSGYLSPPYTDLIRLCMYAASLYCRVSKIEVPVENSTDGLF